MEDKYKLATDERRLTQIFPPNVEDKYKLATDEHGLTQMNTDEYRPADRFIKSAH